MSLFDEIYGSFILNEDNTGPDDDEQTTPQPQNDEGGDEGTEETQAENPDENTDDEYSMDDEEETPETEEENQDDNQEETQDEGEDDEYSMDDEEENQEENPDEEGGEENPEGEDDDYSMDDEEGGGDEGEESTDDSVDQNDPSQRLKDIEKSIFDQLTPEQQQAKTQELKNLYSSTYEKCQDIIDTITNVEKAPNQAKVYDYIMNNLVDLQKYIRDYLDNLFDSKTYIENMTELQKYLAILDTINNVFEEMRKASENQEK